MVIKYNHLLLPELYYNFPGMVFVYLEWRRKNYFQGAMTTEENFFYTNDL